jgi:hypothetical protein
MREEVCVLLLQDLLQSCSRGGRRRKCHNGGEKGNVLIVSVLLSITIYFALRSETQGGVKVRVCVFYYCRTYYKAVRVGGGGEWRTCAMRDDEPRPVWMSQRPEDVIANRSVFIFF